MRMFLLGASGRTGNLVIERGLSRGHEITAVVRSALVEEPRDHLRIVVVAHERQSFADQIVDVERGPGSRIPLEERPNILDHRAGTVPAGHDLL